MMNSTGKEVPYEKNNYTFVDVLHPQRACIGGGGGDADEDGIAPVRQQEESNAGN